MENIKSIQWPLVFGLGAFALLRPLLSIVGLSDALPKPLVPLLATLLISVVWIAVVGLSRVVQPVLTLLFTGLAYGVFALALSGVLSPILSGELRSYNVYGIISVLAVNAVWGVIAGLLALPVSKIRRR